jgi:hypothetical protein
MAQSDPRNMDTSCFVGHARNMGQGLFTMQSDDECNEDLPNTQQSEDFAKPFRLLDLPKEIRLMIYEKLDVVYKRHVVPLSLGGGGPYGTLINASLEGVRILQTCHTINEEASYISGRVVAFFQPAGHVLRSPELAADFGERHSERNCCG